MSLQAITAALAYRGLTPSEKLILIGWANYADEAFRCYPSQRRLSDDTGLSDRQIRRLALSLEERGLIHRQERRRGDGSRSSDLITLVCLQADTMSEGVRTPCPEGADTMSGQNLLSNQSLEANASKESFKSSEFDDFWKCYPHKRAKGAALKAYVKARKVVDHGTLIRAVATQVGWGVWDHANYSPHAASWLNAERWSDEPRASQSPRVAGNPKASANRSGDTSFADIAARRKREREAGMEIPGRQAAVSGDDFGWGIGAIDGQCAAGDWQG